MRKLNVLVVDDAPYVREVIRLLMTKAGFNVIAEAEDGEQAVQMAVEKKPDLIIMDIVMPNKSGIQATKEIMEIMPQTKIIACSTVDQEVLLMRAMEAGAADFIHKPFHAKDVVKIVNKVFGATEEQR